MSKTCTTRVTTKPGEPLPQGNTDWARLDAVADEEVVARPIRPDAQPLTPEQGARMRRVSCVKAASAPRNDCRRGAADLCEEES